VSDGHGGTSVGTLTVTTLAANQTVTVESRIKASADDAEQTVKNGYMQLNSSDLELGHDYGFVGEQLVGLRFRDLDIPVGAVITKAWLEFTATGNSLNPTVLTIRAQNAANAGAFTSSAFNISNRALTASAATWTPDMWPAASGSGPAQKSVDLSALVQEVVSKAGWSPDNALAFVVSGDGVRNSVSFDGSPGAAPLLHVEYKLAGANVAPVASADTATVAEDSVLVIDPRANDTDANGDALTVVAAGLASHGVVTVNADSTISYRPDADFFGTDTFRYTVSDGKGGLSVATVTVTVTGVNDVPQANSDLAVTAANTGVSVKVLANDLDRDGDTLSVVAVGAGQHGTTSLQPNGSVLYTPANGFLGVDTFTYTVSDGHGGTDTATATVHVGVGFGSIEFAFFGDYGVDNGHELAVSQMVKGWNPDFIVTGGDNLQTTNATMDDAIGKYYAEYIGDYVGAYGPGSATNRFFTAIGNHDWTEAGVEAYKDYFSFPESSSGNKLYYDFVKGPVQFFILDADPHEVDGRTADSKQAMWLKQQLENSVTPWQVVVFHHPPYSSTINGNGPTPDMRWPFEEWGVDAVLNGHEHVYERFLRDDNGDGTDLPYITVGTGGAGEYSFGTPDPSSVVRYNSNYGALHVTASDTELQFEFWSVANGGTLIDSYSIQMPLS
jgi:hypothetical protein